MTTDKLNIIKLIRSIYLFPAIVLLLAFIPIEIIRIIFFSYHGGLGWILAMFCTPYVLIRILIFILKAKGEIRGYLVKFCTASFIIYLIVLYPLSIFAENSMRSQNWPIEKGTIYGFMTMPFSMLKSSFWESKEGEHNHLMERNAE